MIHQTRGFAKAVRRRAISAALKSLVKKGDAELKLMSDNAREVAAERYDWARLAPRDPPGVCAEFPQR